MASESQKSVRAKKRAVTKQVNLIKQLMAEEETEKVVQEVVIIKRLFREFTEATECHVAALERDQDIEESDVDYATIQSSYIELLSAVKAHKEN